MFELSEPEFDSLFRYRHTLRKLASKQVLIYEKKTALLKNTVCVKRLLQVFFGHYKVVAHDGRRGSPKTDFITTDPVSATVTTPGEFIEGTARNLASADSVNSGNSSTYDTDQNISDGEDEGDDDFRC